MPALLGAFIFVLGGVLCGLGAASRDPLVFALGAIAVIGVVCELLFGNVGETE